jgi:glycosyltransferase involved in cell wall biosynthesis
VEAYPAERTLIPDAGTATRGAPAPSRAASATVPVAAIIPAYNREAFIGDAVRSAFEQQPLPPAEVIVVDDGSADATADAARDAGARVIVHETNRGSAAARNTGLAATSQPWVAPLDSDDRWLPHMLDALWSHREPYAMVAGASLGTDLSGTPLFYGGILSTQPIVLGTPAPLVFPENFISASGVIIRTAALRSVGGWSEQFRLAEDLDLWLRLLATHSGMCIPRVVTTYRLHPGQKSQAGYEGRATVLRMVSSHRTQPWWREELFARRRAVNAWDDLREALGEGRYRTALARAAFLGSSALRISAVRATVVRRRALRRRGLRLGR